MLTALARPALPGLSRRLPAPTRRQDSSSSSGSYHTAPGSPEPPDVGPDTEGPGTWLWVAPGRGVGAQPVLSVSAQNSRQQQCSGSGFPRGPGSDPQPPRPQLRMLPSGEMEVIFGAGPLFSRSDEKDVEEQQLMAPAFSSPLLSGPASPTPVSPQSQTPDVGSRWATYLELPPRGPSPAVSGQYDCVEVALEERTAPVRPRTVPKRQIELRPRPRSPLQDSRAPRPRLLLRTGSLDESLSRLQAAAGLVQTALARKLGSAVPAPSNITCKSTGKEERTNPQEPTHSTPVVLEEVKSRPPRAHDSSVTARVPRPWPSLRERAIRRDKPAPGTEPLGPVSSSIFLQSEEKIQQAHKQEPKTQFPRETTNRTIPRAGSPPFDSRGSRVVPSKVVRPRSPSPSQQAPNGTVRGPRCPSPENRAEPHRTVWRMSSPSFPGASRAWENRNAVVEEDGNRRNPSPPPRSRWSQGVLRVENPCPEAPLWKIPYSRGGDAAELGRDRSLPALLPRESHHPVEMRSPSPRETWGSMHGSSVVFHQKAMNGLTQELEPTTPSAPGTPELTEAQCLLTLENADIAFRGGQRSPDVATPEPSPSHLTNIVDDDVSPEALSSEEAASGRPRVTIPRPRDVRKMVKTTYAPSFPAGTPGSRLPAPPADACGHEDVASKTQELPALESPAPAHYTSIFLKDFLPVVPHPYEVPESSLHATPKDAPQSSGVPRRRAENNTAKPFARSEIRLPGALALGRRPEKTQGVQGRSPGGENPDAEPQRLGLDREDRTSPLGDTRSSTQCSPLGSAGTRPPHRGSPQACPNSSLGSAPELETPLVAPATAVQAPLPPNPPARAARTAAPFPRAASAPPTDRLPPASSLGMRRPPGPVPPGKVLIDPESGRYYFVEAPRQPRLRVLFDPESGQYVEVLLPPSPSPSRPARQAYSPLGVGPGLYPPAYGPIPGSSLSPLSPNLPALGSLQLPWAPEAGSLEGMYYMPLSGTPNPAPPMFFCAPPSSSGPIQSSKGSVFPL